MIKTYNFHFDFFEKRELPPFYEIKERDSDCISPNKAESKSIENGAVLLIPPYLNYTQKDLKPGYSCSSKSYWIGFAMDLHPFNNFREYLRHQLGKKPYKNLRQDIQRLERGHQIHFQTFYGSIDESTYNNLMDTLKKYIEGRFKGRVHKHTALKKWNHYVDSVYPMIHDKKASIFVIYEKDEPISISLNYHYRDIFIAAIISFNHKFFPYSMGKQMFVRQIEWCYANNYRIIDLGWGSFDYKIKFSNAVFKYNTHIIFPKKNLYKRLLSHGIGWYLYLKYYLVMLKQRKLRNPKKTFKGRWLNFTMDGSDLSSKL